jgi:Sulfotransferase domain
MIDFLIIGAQKAGTTSLFEYMRRHPQIHLPPEKEVSYFDRRYNRGADWYLKTVLRKAPAGATCGEASVGYMGGIPFGELPLDDWQRAASSQYEAPYEEVIPRRIRSLLPDVKLICVLRDPVERAYSQYLMTVLTEAEQRTFDQAIGALMEPEELERSRTVPSDVNSYIVYGEYARILAGFTNVFPAEQLLVVFSHDLLQRPIETLARIFGHVGVADDVIPDNLETRYRTAAVEPRIRSINLHRWQAAAADKPMVRGLWHQAPKPIKRGVDRAYKVASFRAAVWNARRGTVEKSISDFSRRMLVDHYRNDAIALAEIVGDDVPWRASWESSLASEAKVR